MPKGFELEDIHSYQNWIEELACCYSGENVMSFIVKLKRNPKPMAKIKAMKMELGNGWHAEILDKNDPRGATIGFYTDCCMKLGREAESRIDAGYFHASYAFFLRFIKMVK